MADDFFVRFGSDAAAFGRKLDQDLAGARRTISTFTRQLADIETQTANRRAATMKHLAAMSAEADRVQKKIDAIGAASGAAGVNPEVADLQQMARAAYQDIGQIVSGMDAVLLRLKGAADTIDRFDTNLAAERARQNRSDSARARTDQRRDPATGRITSGEGVPMRQQDLQRLVQQVTRAAVEGVQPVSISQIPQATIDEAAFQRVVTAVERNVTATERVEAAIDRLGGRIGTGDATQAAAETAVAPVAQAAAAEAVAVAQRQQGPSRRNQQLDKTIDTLTSRERQLRVEIERLAGEMQEGAQVSAVFGRNLAELADVERRLASARQARASEESRAAQQERQRRAAQREAAAQAGITISPEERRYRQDERARLELAANPERLQGLIGRGQGRLGKAELAQIAETLNRQGYQTDLGATRNGIPRASIAQMVEQITAAGREYVATGRATAEDLSARRVERAPGVIPTDVQNLLGGELPRVAQRFTRELGRLGISVEQAYQLIGANLRSGGGDPRRLQTRGRLEIGAEIGEELRQALLASPDIISGYDRERRAAARGDVVTAMRGNQQFNPYELDLKTTGRDQAAQQARRDVAALLQATQEVDEFATDLGKLDDALRRAQQVQARILRALDSYESLERQPTTDEAAEYTRNLARAEQQAAIVAQRREALDTRRSVWRDPQGGTADFMLEPGFREGLRRRTESREQFEAEAADARESALQRSLGRQALRDAVFEYFGGARTFATTQGNTRDYFARNLPGVRSAGSVGRQRLAFTDDDMMGSPENRRAIRQMTAGLIGYSRRLNELIDEIAEGESTEEQLNQTRQRVIQGLNRLLSGYQSAFPSAEVPNIQSFLPPQLFNAEDYGRVDVSRFDADGAREAARREARSQAGRDAISQLDAQSEAAFKDPRRSQQAREDLLKAIRGNIRAINAEIRDTEDLSDGRREELIAQRERLREARKRVSGRIDPQDLERQYGTVSAAERRQGQITTRLARAGETLARAHEELAQREKFVHDSLSPESARAFNTALAQRIDLTEQINSIRGGDDIRADREEGALDPANVDRAERARAQLAKLETQLGAVNTTLAQYERLAHSVNPNTAFGLNRRPGDFANLETEGLRAGIRNLEQDEARQRQTLGETTRELERMRAELAASTAAFREQNARRGSKAMRDPNIPGFGGGGDEGGSTGRTAAGGDEGGRQGILQQILAALNRIDGRLKGTIRVSGTVNTREGGSVAGEGAAAGGTRTARSTAQGRADFEASIAQTVPAIGQLLGAGNDVEAAAEMVARGVMSETRVLDLFRDKLQQSAQEAKQFRDAVRGAAGDRRLAEAAAAAEEQRAKLQAQQFQTRGGESMSISQARTAMREDLAARKRREDQQRRTSSEERQAAAAALVHAQALSRLTQETKAEIALLERMARETDDSAEAHERLAAQMAKVYGMSAQNMRGRSTETNQAVGQIFKGAGLDVTGEEVAGMRNTARSLGYVVDHTAAQGVVPGGLFGEQSEFTHALFGNAGFWSRVMNSTGTFIVRNFTAGFVFGMTNALQDLLTQAIQAEAIFVRISDALEATGRSSEGLRSDLRGLAVEYGVGLQDVYETTAQLTGLFDNTEDLVGGTEVVTQLQRISMGALTAQEAVGVLAATMGGFGTELDTAFGGDRLAGMTHVADVLTSIQNNLGVNVEVSSEGVGRMAGLAQSLKISFEDAAVYVSQIAKLTNQTGAAAGEQFSRVLGAMQTGRGRQVLTDSLPDTGIEEQLAAGEYGQALQTLLKNWDGLTDAQQRNITVTLGGQRQAATLGALFNDASHVLEATAKAHNANGDAARRNEEIMKTMNAQVGVLMGNFTALADNLLDSGIANSIGVILIMVNKLLSALNWLLNGINDLSESNSFTKVLLEWGAGLAGFLVLLTLLGKSLAGAKASMAAMRGFAIGENAAGEATRPAWSTVTGAPAAVGSRATQVSTNAATRAGAAFAAGNNAAAASHLAVSKAAGVAARASNGVAAGMSRIASAGLTAQIGLALAAAGIITLISDVTAARDRDKQFREQYDKQYGDDGQANTGDEGDPYVGPFTEGMQANRSATLTYGGNFKSLFTAPFRAGNMTNAKSWTDLGFALDRIQGLVPDDQQEDLDKLHFDALSRIKEQIQMPVQTAESVQATNDEVADMLSQARDDIMSSDMSDQQKQAALAEIEQYAAGFDGIITKLRLKAEGVTALDELTTDQINEISEISQLLAANASSGNVDVAALGADLVGNLGLNEDSGIYKRLQRLAQGGISSAESLKIQAANVSLELKNAQEKYNTILTGGETEEGQLASQRQLVLSKAAELVQLTEARLQALISDANTIAELRASRGNFQGAGAAIEAALNKFRAERSDNESNVTRAANNLIEAQGAEQIANQIAAGQNAQLEASKARGVGALESAQIDAEIASNTYQALLAQRRAAQEAGREGPSIRAIRDAKNAWLTAQRQSVLEAQNANIAQLTLAAASEWNALAAGQIQEQIAVQQYADAVKNFGAGSTEALAAQTTLVNQQKQNQQTQDQVAAAQRDAMLASIPRGNTLAIARQTLANAQAAVAAAAKYGQNSTEYQGALAQLYAAQQGLVQTEADLIQSRTAIAIALAQASGNTVKAATLQVKAARQALQAALKNSGGAESAEVNQARAQVISAQAAARDARLQDQLDTIDFNLQMGRITQGSAISALRQILRTQDLTKAQRRQLLLQIKGMQESLSDTQWNFGDIKMPTPYQMRRYIEKNRAGLREAQQRVGAQFQDAYSSGRPSVGAGGGGTSSSVVNNNHQTTITINANRNLREVEEVVKRAVGKGHRVRTAQPRRR